MDDLTKASHKLAEEIYKASAAKQQAQGAQAGPQAGPSAGAAPEQDSKAEPKKEDVIDAEYTTEDDKK